MMHETFQRRDLWQLRSTLGVVCCVFLIVTTAAADTSNSLLDISADGRRLACSNRDSGTVSIVDLESHQLLHEIAVGDKPEGVTFVGQTYNVAVAVYGNDEVVFLDAETGEVTARVEVFDEPYGIVSHPDGTRLYATLDYPGRVVEIDPNEPRVVGEMQVGNFVRGIALDTERDLLLVTEFYTAKVIAIDLDAKQVVDEWKGASTDNLLRQITLHPSRAKAYVPHIRSRVTAVHGDGSVFPYVGVVDTEQGEGRRRKRIPMDAFQANRVTANPWEVSVSPDSSTLFVVFSGTDDMFVCDLIDDDYRELGYRRYVSLGSNPRAVKVAPDSRIVYVYQALDFNIVALDAESLDRVANIPVTENPLDENVLAGKKLFYSALQPMVGRRWISCSSCHPDGEPDGRTWHNPEGLRNTQSLGGMAWTHPIHWSADRDEVQDFEHTIRGPLMQGRGLIRGRVFESLDKPNGGISESLDALAAYANSHKIALSPHAKGGLSDSAKRGQELFFSETTKCAECHSGPFYSDSHSLPTERILRHDVGTGELDDSELMGPQYDTPTLLGVYRTAPYLHHGAAETLMELFTEHNSEDRHGVTSQLSPDDIRDLVEFLKALPFEDPVPDARRLGLRRIE